MIAANNYKYSHYVFWLYCICVDTHSDITTLSVIRRQSRCIWILYLCIITTPFVIYIVNHHWSDWADLSIACYLLDVKLVNFSDALPVFYKRLVSQYIIKILGQIYSNGKYAPLKFKLGVVLLDCSYAPRIVKWYILFINL